MPTSRASKKSWLVEWDWRSVDGMGVVTVATYRYALGHTVVVSGQTYQNRVKSISSLKEAYIDRKKAEFGDVTIELSDLADDGSTNFPFRALEAIDDFEDKPLRVYRYDHLTSTKTLKWWGISKRPDYPKGAHSCTLSGTFSASAIDIEIPSKRMQQRCSERFNGSATETQNHSLPSIGCPYDGTTIGTAGFWNTECPKTPNGCDARGMAQYRSSFTHIARSVGGRTNNLLDPTEVHKAVVQLVYGPASDFIIRPECYRYVIKGQELIVNFVVSAVAIGFPFSVSDITADRVRLGGIGAATAVEFLPGTFPQAIPGNRTLWAEKASHSGVAICAARFALTKAQVERYKNAAAIHAVTVRLPRGRSLVSTGATSSNLVLILRDILEEKRYSIGIPGAEIDSAVITAAAAYNSSRFLGRVELDKPEKLLDLIQHFCANFHGFVTLNGGKLQIRAKKHNETAVATFGTGGYLIDKLQVESKEQDYADVANNLTTTWRTLMRQKRVKNYYDAGAQTKAGNGLEKRINEDLFLYIYDDIAAEIASDMWLREELNQNQEITFETPLLDWEASGVHAGDVIHVVSPDVPEKDSRFLFRVITPETDVAGNMVTVTASLYIPEVYNYTTLTLGEILADGDGTDGWNRPPDVTGFAATITDVNGDDDAREAQVHCVWTWPDISALMSQLAAEGQTPEVPWEGLQIKYRYQDQKKFHLKDGPFVRWPLVDADVLVPFHRNRQLEMWAVAVGRNQSTGEVGYIIDPTQATYLTATLSATAATAAVGDASFISAGEYLRCEDELMLVSGAPSGGSVPLTNVSGVRTPQFNTNAVAHSAETEIGVAVASHPTALVDMRTRRYTLPVVTNLAGYSRRHGIHYKWTKLAHEQLEHYWLYYTYGTGLDAGSSFITGWGITSDPRTPPAGVVLVPTKTPHKLIPWEELDAAFGGDAAGQTPKAVVIAKIKNNFSSAPSALATGGGHTNGPVYAPADPIAGDITQDPTVSSDRVPVFFEIFFDTTHNSSTGHTADEAEATTAGVTIEKWIKGSPGNWSGQLVRVPVTIDDGTVKSIKATTTLHRGSKWRVVRAFTSNDSKKRRRSNAVNLAFQVGSQSDDIATITLFSITSVTAEDAHVSYVNWGLTQPATPVGLLSAHIEAKQTAGSTWRRAGHQRLINDPTMQTTGAKVPPPFEVRHKKNTPMDYRIVLTATDGSTATATSSSTSADESTGDLPIESGANGPSYPSTNINHIALNEVVGDLTKAMVVAKFHIYMDGSDALNNWGTPNDPLLYGIVRQVTLFFRYSGRTDLMPVHAALLPTEGTLAAQTTITGHFIAGLTVEWVKTIYQNNSDTLVRNGTSVSFVAGSDNFQFDGTPPTSVTYTKIKQHNKKTILRFTATQPSKPIYIKSLVAEVSYDGGSTWRKSGREEILQDNTAFNSAGASKTADIICHHKAGQTNMKFRVIVVPVGSSYQAGTAAPNGVYADSAITTSDAEHDGFEGVPSAPTIDYALITHSGIHFACAKYPDGRAIRAWEIQASSNSAFTGTFLDLESEPTAVGSSGTIYATGRVDHFPISKRDLPSTAFWSGSADPRATLSLYIRIRVRDWDPVNQVERVSAWTVKQVTQANRSLQPGTKIPHDLKHRSRFGLIDNPHFFHGRGSTQYNVGSGTNDQVARQVRFGITGALNATSVLNSTKLVYNSLVAPGTTDQAKWIQADHRLSLNTSGYEIAFKVGKLSVAGQFMSFAYLIGSSDGGTLTSVTGSLQEIQDNTSASGNASGGGRTIIIGATATRSSVPTPLTSASYFKYSGLIRPDSAYAMGNGNLFFSLSFVWSGARTIYIDEVLLEFGKETPVYQPTSGDTYNNLDPVVNLNAVTAMTLYAQSTGSETDLVNAGDTARVYV